MDARKEELKTIPERAVSEAAEALYYFLKDDAVIIPAEADGRVNINYRKLYSDLERQDEFVILVSPPAYRFINILAEHINNGIGNNNQREQ